MSPTRWLATLAVVGLLTWTGPADALTRATVPGAVDERVTQATIHATICRHGWAASVRPPVAWTDALKRRLMHEQHLAGRLSDWRLDHLLPIEGGGSPTSLANLWMEPAAESHLKDADEGQMNRDICSGRLTLAVAQAAMIRKWGPLHVLDESAESRRGGLHNAQLDVSAGDGRRAGSPRIPVDDRRDLSC